MPNYGDPDYWIKRYNEQEGTTFDWLEDYDAIKPILEELNFPKSSMVLNIGCGNSEFSEQMYDDGYINNYNIDIADNVIDFMKERNKHRKGIVFEKMDVKNMKYPDNTFDLIIDKSTIDALLCGDFSFMNVAQMTKEIQRTLKVGGIYFIISYGEPENRMPHLERDHLAFDIQIYTIKKENDNNEKEKMHYGYICKKLPTADEKALNFDLVYKELEQQELEEEEEDENDNENDNEKEEINPQFGGEDDQKEDEK